MHHQIPEYVSTTIQNHLHKTIIPNSKLAALEEWLHDVYDIPAEAMEGVFYQEMDARSRTTMYKIKLTEPLILDEFRRLADQRDDLTYEQRTMDGTQYLTLLEVSDDQRSAFQMASFEEEQQTVVFSLISEDQPFEAGSAVDNTLKALQLYFTAREETRS